MRPKIFLWKKLETGFWKNFHMAKASTVPISMNKEGEGRLYEVGEHGNLNFFSVQKNLNKNSLKLCLTTHKKH